MNEFLLPPYLASIAQMGVYASWPIPVFMLAYFLYNFTTRVSGKNTPPEEFLDNKAYRYELIQTLLFPGIQHLDYYSKRRSVAVITIYVILLLLQYFAPYLLSFLLLGLFRTWAIFDIAMTIKKTNYRKLKKPQFRTVPNLFIVYGVVIVIIFIAVGNIRDMGFVLSVENEIFNALLQVNAILFGFMGVLAFYLTQRLDDMSKRIEGKIPTEDFRIRVNSLFSFTFLIFLVGMALSIIGMFGNSDEMINVANSYTLLKGMPMLFFVLDVSCVIVGVSVLYELWKDYQYFILI